MNCAEQCIFSECRVDSLERPRFQSEDGTCTFFVYGQGVKSKSPQIVNCCYESALAFKKQTDQLGWVIWMDETLEDLSDNPFDMCRRRAILAAHEQGV